MKLLGLLASVGLTVYVYVAVWDHQVMLAACCAIAAQMLLLLTKGENNG